MADLSNYSIISWILKNGIKNEKGELFEFKDHFFLYDILRDFSPEQVIKKCSQIGASVAMNLKVFFMADKKGIGSIYTMPSDSDVEEFSKTKTDRIFQANQCIRERIKLDNVGLKQIGDYFVYFKGTRSKAAPISTTTDCLIHDEKDRSDLKIVEDYQSRITASKYRWTWSLSNPSAYNIGIDLDWKLSDKKEWFITCLGCGKEQFLTWEDNVDEIKEIYVCSGCQKEFTKNERRLGKWKPTGTGRISGYHISQMMAPWLTASDLIKVKEKQGIAYFRNFILGEPYSAGEITDFSKAILDIWTPSSIDNGQLYMGIDVGKEKHWVLGSKEGIFRIGKCESRSELEEIIYKYNPIVVMDSGPERTWAEEFRNKFPKLWVCFYRKDKEGSEMIKWGGMKNSEEEYQKLGYVWIDRNRIIDDLVYNLQRGEFQINLNRDDLERYIEHWQTMRRMEEINALGQKRYVWESSTGVNHFASATWFWWVATRQSSEPAVILHEKGGEDKKVIQITSEGMVMRDLKEIMEEMKQ